MINRYQTLWLGGGPKVSIPVSQYDTMWRFIFTVINGSVEWTIPTGATAVLNGRKPDGNVIAISGTIADNKVTVDATEQMTVVAGEVVCELSIMSGGAVVGTANFTLAVEDAPKKDGEPISESDLSAYAEMIAAAGELVEEAQEIIEQGPFLPPGGTPGQVLTKTASGTEWDDASGLPEGGSNGQVLTKTSSGAAWSDAGTPTQAQIDSAVADWLDAHPEAVTNIPAKVKQALLACFQKVAWVDANGQTYYDVLYNALMNKEVLSIAAVFTQGSAVIYDTEELDNLRQYLTVTASYDDGTTGVVTAYELSGTLTEGTSTITVEYGGQTDTFDVVVTHQPIVITSMVYGTFGFDGTGNCFKFAKDSTIVARAVCSPSFGFVLENGKRYTFSLGSKASTYNMSIRSCVGDTTGLTFEPDATKEYPTLTEGTIMSGWVSADYSFVANTNTDNVVVVVFRVPNNTKLGQSQIEEIYENFTLTVS